MGLSGSYTTLSKGYHCIGINPANLAAYKYKSFNILDFSLSLSNNFFSINNYNLMNGAHLDDETDSDYYSKEDLFSDIKGTGIRILYSSNIPMPLLNFSLRNFGVSSRLTTNFDMGIPDGMVQLFTSGNNTDLIMNIEESTIITQEMGFSYAHKFTGFSAGATLKYLLGLFYMGIEPVSSTAIQTSSEGFKGNPKYILQQSIGGGGIGLDIGITSDETENGFRYGISVINLLGTIKWTADHFMRSSLENSIRSGTGDYYLRPNEFMLIDFVIDIEDATQLGTESEEAPIYYAMYKVIPLENIDNINLSSADQELLITLENGTYLLPSGGEYIKKILLGGGDEERRFIVDRYQYVDSESAPFTTRHPVYFRLGLSKQWEDDLLIGVDLATGFSNRFGSSSDWKLSFGSEIYKFKNKILRMGYSFGGISQRSISFGYGTSFGAFNIDLGIALNGGFTLANAKGIDIAFGLNWGIEK